jgi:ankyrin repeat protein
MIAAVRARDHEGVDRLLAQDSSLAGARSAEGVSAILLALYVHDRALVDRLRAVEPPLDAFDAAALGDAGLLAELVRADPELVGASAPDGFTPLHLTAYFGGLDAARVLLDRGADPDAVAATTSRVQPIHSAVAGRHHDLVKLLLEHGADPNARQEGGWTPLQAAAQHGDQAIVELLLDAGADRTGQADDGSTAADRATAAGHADLAGRLRARADP